MSFMVIKPFLTTSAPAPVYDPILPDYDGLQINSNSLYCGGIAIWDGELFFATWKGGTAAASPIPGMYRVNRDTHALTRYYAFTPPHSYNDFMSGLVVSDDGQRLFSMAMNAGYGSGADAYLVQFKIGGGTTALYSVRMPYEAQPYYGKGATSGGKGSHRIGTGQTFGSDNGDRFEWIDVDDISTPPSTAALNLNFQGGMPNHSGYGISYMEFDGFAYFGGTGSNTVKVPLWRVHRTTHVVQEWCGADSRLAAINATTLNASGYSQGIQLARTSNTSGTKRLYAFSSMSNGIAYLTAAGGAWTKINLPSGEYFGNNLLYLNSTDNGKVYFVTCTATGGGGTWRVRSIDESGTLTLLSTLPSNATMFPGGFSVGVLSDTVYVETSPDGSVDLAVGVLMYGASSGSGTATVGDFYLHVVALV